MAKVAVFILSGHRSSILGSFIGMSIGLYPMMLLSYHYQTQICETQHARFSRNLRLERFAPMARNDEKGNVGGGAVKEKPMLSSMQINLLSDKVMSSNELAIDGWWMSHTKWNATYQCDQQDYCSQLFTTACRKQITTAIYQFLPIEQNSMIIGIEFDGKGSSQSNFGWKNKKMDSAVNGAQVLLKYMDESYEIVRLFFPTGNYSMMSAHVTKLFTRGKQIQSITAMLTCYGYDGFAQFQDVTINPIFAKGSRTSLPKDRNTCVSSCPPYFKPKEASVPFDVETIHVANKSNMTSRLTLVTHLSLDRIEALQAINHVWSGAMAITIYVPAAKKDRNSTETTLERSRRALQKAVRGIQFSDESDVTGVYGRNETDEYPTNHMRNIGIRQVKTDYFVMLDADFVPCPEFETRFLETMQNVENKEEKIAYVVPVFEGRKEVTASNLPKTKGELKAMTNSSNPEIFPFAYYTSPLSHHLTNCTKWYTAWKPYKIKKYEDGYEPYYVLRTKNKNMPLFDTRFSGYGFNKIQHTIELMHSGYSLQVLPNVWATHVYHRISSIKKRFLNGPITRLENRIKRYEYVAEVMRKYNIGPCADTT